MEYPNDPYADWEEPERKQWLINTFDIELREEFKAYAKRHKTTICLMLEKVVRKEMNRKQLRRNR